RNKDDDQRDGGGQHRERYFLCRLDRRPLWLVVFFFDVSNDVLEHYDCIVDDDPDRKRQRKQRHVVQREIHRLEQGESGDDRSRYRKRRDKNRPQISNEQQHDQARKQASKQQVFLQRRHRSVYEHRLIADDPYRDAGWKRLLNLLDLFLYRVDDLD